MVHAEHTRIPGRRTDESSEMEGRIFVPEWWKARHDWYLLDGASYHQVIIWTAGGDHVCAISYNGGAMPFLRAVRHRPTSLSQPLSARTSNNLRISFRPGNRLLFHMLLLPAKRASVRAYRNKNNSLDLDISNHRSQAHRVPSTGVLITP
jgi:hypothetical protein